MSKSPLSITIICYNEAKNLPRVLASAAFADEIIVVDDNSCDGSSEIAKEHGAIVFNHPFEGYGQQKNFAASQAKHEWVFSIDADEEITPELKASILNVINNNESSKLYSVNRKTYFLDKFIRFGGWYPDNVPRLYRRAHAKFTQPKVHELLVTDDGSDAVVLSGALNHFSFPTVQSQVERNLKYAKLGALELLQKKGRPSLLSVFIRPCWKIFECAILKGGIIDGIPGIIIAINAGYSMFMKYSFAYFDFKNERNKIGE